MTLFPESIKNKKTETNLILFSRRNRIELGKAQYKVEGGKLIKVQLKLEDEKIKEAKITGDFFLHPEELIDELEKKLEGSELNENVLADHIKAFIKRNKAVLLGVTPEDFAKCIVMAGAKND
jgi:lipoate-protein ligase A